MCFKKIWKLRTSNPTNSDFLNRLRYSYLIVLIYLLFYVFSQKKDQEILNFLFCVLSLINQDITTAVFKKCPHSCPKIKCPSNIPHSFFELTHRGGVQLYEKEGGVILFPRKFWKRQETVKWSWDLKSPVWGKK